MAETTEKTKKAKAPAKPRAVAAPKAAKTSVAKTATAKTTSIDSVVARSTPTHDEISHLARQYWAERGHHDGQAEQDWLRAERELMKLAS